MDDQRTVVVETRNGPRRILASALNAPRGYRRCFYCCLGVLILDDDDEERAHRIRMSPRTSDDRWAEWGAGARERAMTAHPASGLGNLRKMEF